MVVCPKCNHENIFGSNFCNKCGSVLSGEPLAMSISEAAEMIGCTNQSVVDLIDRGALTLMGDDGGKRRYVSRASVLRFCNVLPDYVPKFKLFKEMRAKTKDRELKINEILKKKTYDHISGLENSDTDEQLRQVEVFNMALRYVADLMLSGFDRAVFIDFFVNGCSYEEIVKRYYRCNSKERVDWRLGRIIEQLNKRSEMKLLDYDRLFQECCSLKYENHKFELLLGGEIPVTLLNLSEHALYHLDKNGISTLNQLRESEATLGKMRINRKALTEIEQKLEKLRGLSSVEVLQHIYREDKALIYGFVKSSIGYYFDDDDDDEFDDEDIEEDIQI